MDYLRLKENWLLRGWDKLPASLVDRDSQAVSFIPPEVLVMFKQNNGVLIRRSALRTPMQNRIVVKLNMSHIYWKSLGTTAMPETMRKPTLLLGALWERLPPIRISQNGSIIMGIFLRQFRFGTIILSILREMPQHSLGLKRQLHIVR